ncbi:GntR family transcriptional regulator [Insolitispirillum peregrinum]|uniref:GntR family transcriptional regulator n=1 Tax=Insolitispirillum peregrinum TaxID=80876 RepID=UPI00361C4E70
MSRSLDHLHLPQVSRITTSDYIAQALKSAIIGGSIPPGEPLRQDEIAAQFDVSKIPVREALKRLEAEGLVTIERNRGAVVAGFSSDEITEYVEIRAALESFAAQQAALRITADSLDLAWSHMDNFRLQEEAGARTELNWLFHSTLYRDANRPILMAELRSLYDKLERYVRASLALDAGEPIRSNIGHVGILEAFRRRDADAAAQLTRAHVLEAGASLVTYIHTNRPSGG